MCVFARARACVSVSVRAFACLCIMSEVWYFEASPLLVFGFVKQTLALVKASDSELVFSVDCGGSQLSPFRSVGSRLSATTLAWQAPSCVCSDLRHFLSARLA